MKKRVLISAFFLSALLCGFAYAKEKEFNWVEFYNASGETVYYPVYDVTPKEAENSLSGQSGNFSAPETAEIGDIFLGEDGYERVIAVNEDGAFVTETISPEEIQTYDTLYTWKAASADPETISDIAKKLEMVGWWPEEQSYFVDTDGTEIVNISFQLKMEDRDYAEHQMMQTGTIFLALFDDLTEIHFSYILENNNAQIEYGICWDLDAAQEALEGTDVKSYAESKDEFSELMNILQNW